MFYLLLNFLQFSFFLSLGTVFLPTVPQKMKRNVPVKINPDTELHSPMSIIHLRELK